MKYNCNLLHITSFSLFCLCSLIFFLNINIAESSCASSTSIAEAVAGKLGGKMSPELSGNLFELIMNSQRPLEKPLCAECTTNLIDCLDQQLDTFENQVAEYSKVS